jgi:twinkle protein
MATITPDALLAAIMKVKRTGKKRRGVSTGFESVDEYLMLNKKCLTLITGFPGRGKSEFVDALAVNTALMHNWKWFFYSTENDDFSVHLVKLITKKIGKALFYCTEEEIRDAVLWASDYFAWMDSGDTFYSIDDVLEQTALRIEAGNEVDVLVIDPWNELNHAKQGGRDDVYISDCTAKINRHAKKYDYLPLIVIHPRGIEKNKDGNYPIPHLRDCNGGAMWWSKARTGICVHRKDLKIQGAHIYIQKVKDKMLGYPGETFLDYDFGSGRFKDVGTVEFTLPPEMVEAPFI